MIWLFIAVRGFTCIKIQKSQCFLINKYTKLIGYKRIKNINQLQVNLKQITRLTFNYFDFFFVKFDLSKSK